MSKVHKAVMYSMSSRYIGRVINLISIVLIARMLTPDELGIYAIAATIVLISGEFKSFGAGSYLIREKELDQALIRNALGLSILISWGVGFALILSSEYISHYFGKGDLEGLFLILSIAFFFSPHISIGKSLMSREFEFRRIFIIEVSSQIAQLSSAIILILFGFSYFALAWSGAICYAVELLAVILLRTEGFVVIPQFNDVKKLAKFGVFVTTASVFRKVSENFPDLIIGKVGSSAEVAFFSRGAGFLNFLTATVESGIRPVVTPFLAEKKRLGQNQGDAYLLASKFLGALIVPVLAVAGYASETVIEFFFGDQWGRSVALVTILSVWSIIRSFYILSPAFLIMAGHEKTLFYKDLCILILTGLAIYHLYPFGLESIAKGLVGVAFIEYVVVSAILKLLDIDLNKQLLSVSSNVLVAAICLASAAAIDFIVDFNEMPPVVVLSILLPSMVLAWITSLALIKHPLYCELKITLAKVMQKYNA